MQDRQRNPIRYSIAAVTTTLKFVGTKTSNLSKAHVTRDSSDPAIWESSVRRAIAMHLEGVSKFEAFVRKTP